MKFTNKKLILFDLDGTLIDSAPDLTYAVNAMLEEMGLPRYDLDTVHHWVGNGAQMLVKRSLLGRRDVENETIDSTRFEEALARFMAHYRAHLCEETYAYAGVPDTLDALKCRGYTLAVVTNKPYPFVSPILDRLSLSQYFAYTVGGDSLPVKKPDPAPLLYLCKKLGYEVAQSLMVGDSKNDILAANACGMESVGVTYGYNYGENIAVHQPTVVIEKFEALLTIL